MIFGRALSWRLFCPGMLAATCYAATSASAQADALFSAPTLFEAADGVGRVAVGEFNDDGKPDLAMGSPFASEPNVLVGQLDGSFVLDAGSVIAGVGVSVIAAGDLNGDGRDDLVIADLTNTLTIHLALPAGGFETAQSFEVPEFAVDVALSDIDGNGIPDVVCASGKPEGEFTPGSGSVSVFLGAGQGSFVPASRFHIGTAFVQVTTGDFNRDGYSDVIALTYPFDGMVLAGNANGWLTQIGTIAAIYNPRGIATDDFDADGRLDVAIGSSPGVKIFLGNGVGGFEAGIPITTPQSIRDLTVADFDGDGQKDLAATMNNVLSIAVMLGQGEGQFAAPATFASGASAWSLVAADFNADGHPDLAMSCGVVDKVAVLLNQTPRAAMWIGLGSGLAGASGIPSLLGAGTQTAGSATFLELTHAKPLSSAILFVGLENTPTPFKGGLLVPASLLAPVLATTGPGGAIAWIFHWPSGLPRGLSLYYQLAIVDGAAVNGVALSNALQSQAP